MNTALESLDPLDEPVFPETENNQRRRLDYLGYAPCPLRNELRQRLHRHFCAIEAKEGAVPAWFMPAGCHSPNPYDELWQTTDAAELPGLISETGFGDYNRPEFARRWFDTGVFGKVEAGVIRPEFHEAGLVDPLGQLHVYGAVPELILVDLKRLGDRPLPRTWADVLHPRFRHDVILSGEPGEIHESLVHCLSLDHGEAGMAALGANVRDFFHPAEMAKMAGSANPKGAALYILPNFFAKSCPHREAVKVVWPEEGAYLNPLYLFRKRDAGTAVALVQDYLCGTDWSAHLAKVGFVPARADAPALPGKLRWVGWAYVRSNDLTSVAATMNAAFVRGYESSR